MSLDSASVATMPRVIPHRYLARTLFWHILLCHLAPVLGTIAALAMLPWMRPGPIELTAAFIMWFLAFGVGISVGFHRLFSHRAFTVPTPLRVVIGICGSMAGQGPLIGWVALHRCHHQFSDQTGDPHSPCLSGNSFLQRLNGLWHAHFGWVLDYDMPDPLHFCPDLLKDKTISWTSRNFLAWYLAGMVLPALVVGLITSSGVAALQTLLWAGCVRVCLGSQVTWCINSLCHLVGRHPHDTGDHSKNLVWLSVLSFGESWHNNHHAYPSSAAFGHRWWQVDLGYMCIRFLKMVGLARHVRTPDA